MKAKLIFNLDDEEETEKFHLMSKAPDMLRALYEVKDLLRSWDKYGPPQEFNNPTDVIDQLRQQINTIIYERVGEI